MSTNNAMLIFYYWLLKILELLTTLHVIVAVAWQRPSFHLKESPSVWNYFQGVETSKNVEKQRHLKHLENGKHTCEKMIDICLSNSPVPWTWNPIFCKQHEMDISIFPNFCRTPASLIICIFSFPTIIGQLLSSSCQFIWSHPTAIHVPCHLKFTSMTLGTHFGVTSTSLRISFRSHFD